MSSMKHGFDLVAGLSQKDLEEIETCMSKTIRRLFGTRNYANSAMLLGLAKTPPLKQLCYMEAMKRFVNIKNSMSESFKYVLVYRATKASILGVKSTVHVQSLSSIIVNLCKLYDLPDCRSLVTNRYCGRTLARNILQQEKPFHELNDRNKILYYIAEEMMNCTLDILL